MSKTRAIKASAYFSMTRKYLRMFKELSNLPKICEDFTEYETLKNKTRKDFAYSLDNNEINEWLNSSYSESCTWLLDLRTQED